MGSDEVQARMDAKKAAGGRVIAGGGGGSFVRWPKNGETMAVEGVITKLWDSQHGPAASLNVTWASENAVAGPADALQPVEPGQSVNVDIGYATLKGRVTEEMVGLETFIGFVGWGESKNGQFRDFNVVVSEDGSDSLPF